MINSQIISKFRFFAFETGRTFGRRQYSKDPEEPKAPVEAKDGPKSSFIRKKAQMASQGAIQKPQLRGLLQSVIKRNLAVATVLSIATGIAWKVFIIDARKQKYAEFYRCYDAEKDFERMRAAGVLPNAKD